MARETAESIKRKLDKTIKTLEETLTREMEQRAQKDAALARIKELEDENKHLVVMIGQRNSRLVDLQETINEFESPNQEKMTIEEVTGRLIRVINSCDCQLTRKEAFKQFISKSFYSINKDLEDADKAARLAQEDVLRASGVLNEVRQVLRNNL